MIRFAKLALLIFLATAAAARAASPEARLGINLAGPADWMTELPFVDVFRTSRPWISQRKGAAWGQGPELVLDELGWVKKLDADCFAESMLCTVSTTTAHPPTIPSSTPRSAGPASTGNG